MHIKQIMLTVQHLGSTVIITDISVDGYVSNLTANQTWANKIAGAGTAYNYTAAGMYISIASGTVADRWSHSRRAIIIFDASSLLGRTADLVTLEVFCTDKDDDLAITPDINVYSSSPASNTNLVAADFSAVGSTPFSTAVPYASVGFAAYTSFSFNSDGIAAVNTALGSDGIVKLSLRNANYDVAAVSPVWSLNEDSFFYILAEENGVGTPRLTIRSS